jgi:SAM-dependent methyltransferase
MERYLSGEELYGESLTAQEIEQWFEEEREGYYQLAPRTNYVYGYSAINDIHGFQHLPDRPFDHVLGIGSAKGIELEPILHRARRVTILEPSEEFASDRFEYVKPQSSGLMPFADQSFDLIVCLGVLHHIPNVSTVLREIERVLRPNGWLLLREPIVSMGDWSQRRRGLTRNERGIPLPILRRMIQENHFEIVKETKCMFSLTSRLHYFMRGPVYCSPLVVRFDRMVCSIPIWSKSYHPKRKLDRLRPVSIYYVLRKPN